MAKNKTAETTANLEEFINSFANTEQKRQDSVELLKIMQDVTRFKPKMWGPSIIGFGSYHYKYESGHEGDAPLVGFSPRKAEFSLYAYSGLKEHEHLLQNVFCSFLVRYSLKDDAKQRRCIMIIQIGIG